MEKSCGAVIFRLQGGERYYLVLHDGEGYWDFPKGHVKEGETEMETAKREVLEETGLKAISIMPGFRHRIAYFMSKEGRKVKKEVIFFVAFSDMGEVALSHEHAGFEWLPFEEAKNRLTYENAKRLLCKAEAYLAKQKDSSQRASKE